MSSKPVRRFIVDESANSLSYMIAWVSSGGWITTEKSNDYQELKDRSKELEGIGLKPAMFIILGRNVKEDVNQ